MKGDLLIRAAQANGHPYPWVMPNGFGERPWGHESRYCCRCGKVGPRCIVAEGKA